jgi:hypothetical protein
MCDILVGENYGTGVTYTKSISVLAPNYLRHAQSRRPSGFCLNSHGAANQMQPVTPKRRTCVLARIESETQSRMHYIHIDHNSYKARRFLFHAYLGLGAQDVRALLKAIIDIPRKAK